jgi:hypothetical protein
MVISARRLITVFSFFLLSGSISCRKENPNGIPNMNITLASNDSKPMGGKVFRSIFGKLYQTRTINNNAQPFDLWHQNYLRNSYHENGSIYILVSPFVSLRKKEAAEMRKFIRAGNTMLMVTDGVTAAFKEAFGVGIVRKEDTVATSGFGLAETYKFLADSTLFQPQKFGYYCYPFTASVDTPKGVLQTAITLNMLGLKDGIQMKIGSGELILVTNAEALSNYFLLSGNNYNYALGMLSYLGKEPDAIYYDEFYRRNLNRPEEDRSVFDAIFSVPALRAAFWLLLGLCALAIFTNLFRKQRPIPLQQSNRNTSVEFTHTIARLYYNKKDNNNIALKMIQHFLEHIRTKYYLPPQKMDNAFAAVLAGKTNQPIPKTERLVKRMAAIQQGATVTDDLLLELNRQIAELIKTTK